MTQHKGTPPARVCARPDPATWNEDELMTLSEAAALFWPDGPLSEDTLRTAVRDGRLPVSEIARKLFTTKRALSVLHVCTPRSVETQASADAEKAGSSASPPLFACSARINRG